MGVSADLLPAQALAEPVGIGGLALERLTLPGSDGRTPVKK